MEKNKNVQKGWRKLFKVPGFVSGFAPKTVFCCNFSIRNVTLILLDTLITDRKYQNMTFLKSLMFYLAEVQGRSRWDHSTAHVRCDHLSTNHLLPCGQQCILGLKIREHTGSEGGGGLAVSSRETIITPAREDSGWASCFFCSRFVHTWTWTPQTSFKRCFRASMLSEKEIKNNLEKFIVCVSACVRRPAVSMVTPSMSVAHVGTLLANVDVIQGPLILLSVVVLDPAEPCGTGPEHKRRKTLTKELI